MKRRLVLPLLAAVAAGIFSPWAAPASAQQTELVFSITEARAYAAKISISKEVIEANAAASGPCKDNPATPYNDCDKSVYNQTLNCPTPPGIGRTGALPGITVPPGAMLSGKAGYTPLGSDPPQSTPVRLNDIISLGRLAHQGAVLEAGGFASKRYVDLDGRAVPEAHTESDGFSPNRNAYEERCFPTKPDDGTFQGSASSFTHVFARSSQEPLSFHLAECLADQCKFVSDSLGPTTNAANRAITAIHLREQGGKVFGQLSATIEGFSYSGGTFTAEAITTYMEFSSDGTKDGLNWKVISSASGTKIAGQPTPLPAGAPPVPVCPATGACFAVGMAAPYVKSTADGKQLTMIAPGLVIATDQQTAYYAGGELYAGMDRAVPPPTGTGSIPGIQTITSGGFSFIPGIGSAGQFVEAPAAPVVEAEPERTIAIRQIDASPWPAGSILAFGGAAFLLLLAGWLQRFGWGKRLYGVQPFRFFFWIYRAFIRT